jgi:hypothetical protein
MVGGPTAPFAILVKEMHHFTNLGEGNCTRGNVFKQRMCYLFWLFSYLVG